MQRIEELELFFRGLDAFLDRGHQVGAAAQATLQVQQGDDVARELELAAGVILPELLLEHGEAQAQGRDVTVNALDCAGIQREQAANRRFEGTGLGGAFPGDLAHEFGALKHRRHGDGTVFDGLFQGYTCCALMGVLTKGFMFRGFRPRRLPR